MTQEHPHAELSAYIDGALAPAAQAAVGGHLATCAPCRAHVAQLRGTVAFMRALPDPVPSRRLVPRLATPPAWLAPLRTLMTLASGAAVFLFIASSLVTNINFLASSGAATSANEASRDAVAKLQVPAAAGAPATTGVPAPAASPFAAFAVSPAASPAPTTSQVPDTARGTATDDPQKRADQSTAGPSGAPGAVAANPQDTGRLTSSEPQRSPLLNPWLWLTLAVLCAVIAIALQRRLRASI
ncbi:MAG: zf-HC2 domain-containing protein [Chloroflexota bacterium]|nr:zf-HC2 domain-containing protein [Chloroflexota bacterium]